MPEKRSLSSMAQPTGTPTAPVLQTGGHSIFWTVRSSQHTDVTDTAFFDSLVPRGWFDSFG